MGTASDCLMLSQSHTRMLYLSTEKGGPQPAGGGEAQHPGAQGSGGQAASPGPEGGVLAQARAGGPLAGRDEVWLRWASSSFLGPLLLACMTVCACFLPYVERCVAFLFVSLPFWCSDDRVMPCRDNYL